MCYLMEVYSGPSERSTMIVRVTDLGHQLIKTDNMRWTAPELLFSAYKGAWAGQSSLGLLHHLPTDVQSILSPNCISAEGLPTHPTGIFPPHLQFMIITVVCVIWNQIKH